MNNRKLVHWLLMGGRLRLVQQGENWAGLQPTRPLLAAPNVTAHTSVASVPITILLYLLLCRFTVLIKGLAWISGVEALGWSERITVQLTWRWSKFPFRWESLRDADPDSHAISCVRPPSHALFYTSLSISEPAQWETQPRDANDFWFPQWLC